MAPHRMSFSIDITPQKVLDKIGTSQKLQVPDGFTFVAASSDLNLSYAITTTIVAFKRDMTATVIAHFITATRIGLKLSDAEYNQKVYAALT